MKIGDYTKPIKKDDSIFIFYLNDKEKFHLTKKFRRT